MRASAIAKYLGGRLINDDVDLIKIAPLFAAQSSDLSFILWPKDHRHRKSTRAGCVIADLAFAADYADEIDASIIVVEDFYQTFSLLKTIVNSGFLVEKSHEETTERFISPDADISPHAYIGRARIAPHAKICARAFIGDDVDIGEKTLIEEGAVIHNYTVIGARSRIGANSVIGGNAFVPNGFEVVKNLPSLGRVVVEDDVSVGALCTIDRALIFATRIKRGTLIDNLVHIGHDTVIGENVVIAGQSGCAGFVRIGDYVTIGGQVGVAPHVCIDARARVSGKSMVHCDIKRGEIWSGNPSVPHAIYLRAYGNLMTSFKGSIRD